MGTYFHTCPFFFKKILGDLIMTEDLDQSLQVHDEQGSMLVELVLATLGALMLLASVFSAGSQQIDVEKLSSFNQELGYLIDRIKSLKRTSSNNITNNNYLLLSDNFLIANADLPKGMIMNGWDIQHTLSGRFAVAPVLTSLNTFVVRATILNPKYCIDAVIGSWKPSGASKMFLNNVLVAQNSIVQPQLNLGLVTAGCGTGANTIQYEIQW